MPFGVKNHQHIGRDARGTRVQSDLDELLDAVRAGDDDALGTVLGLERPSGTATVSDCSRLRPLPEWAASRR